MKNFTFILLPALLMLSVFHESSDHASQKAAGPVELTDLKDIPFAWNLTDWQGKHIDSLSLDIYYPTRALSNKKYPVVVFAHSGGFTGGDKSNVSSLCDILADYGYICVAFNYRTGYIKGGAPNTCTGDTTTMFDAHYRAFQDADACYRFVKAYGSKYHIDTSLMFSAGTSAGADVTLNSAYLNDSTAAIYYSRAKIKLGSLDSSGNTYPSNYILRGIGAMWGSLVSSQLIDKKYRAYPTLLFKGDDDQGLPDSVGNLYGCSNYQPPVYAGAGIYARMLVVNAPCVYYELPNASHSAYDDEFCMENVACYFNNIMLGKPYSGKYSFYTPSCPQFNGEF